MRRVGLVAYWYPPRESAGVLRAAALARYLPAFGWQPVVVTARPPARDLRAASTGLPASAPGAPSGQPRLDDLPAPALATSDRAWHSLARAAVEAWRGPDALESLKTENVLAARRPHARAAHWLYRHVLSFPDDTWPWLVERGPIVRTFAAHEVEAIVSTAPPPTAHLVAAAAARRLRVPWIADYRDPWSQRSAWRRAWPLSGVEARLERHTLSAAAHVVTVSEPMAVNLRRLLGRPVSVVPNGFDPADRAAAAVDPLPLGAGRFTLLHTGTLTTGSREPGLLFAALDAIVGRGDLPVASLEVWFVGHHLEVARRAAAAWPRLAPALRFVGPVPRATALDAQRRATALVALGSPDRACDGDVPTKVFEYLDAGRPVLAIASAHSALTAVLAETRGGCSAATAAEAEAALVDWLARWRRDGQVPADGDRQAIARYERRRLTGEFAAILDRVAGGVLDQAG